MHNHLHSVNTVRNALFWPPTNLCNSWSSSWVNSVFANWRFHRSRVSVTRITVWLSLSQRYGSFTGLYVIVCKYRAIFRLTYSQRYFLIHEQKLKYFGLKREKSKSLINLTILVARSDSKISPIFKQQSYASMCLSLTPVIINWCLVGVLSLKLQFV